MKDSKKCATCSFYYHKPNILGGVAECSIKVKTLMTFWPNESCDKYKETDTDNLKPQNDLYGEIFDGELKIDSKEGLKLTKVRL